MSISARKRDRAPHDPNLMQMARLHLLSAAHTTATLARALRVSVPTAFRIVKRLRADGAKVVSVKDGKRWHFELREDRGAAWRSDPLLGAIGIAKGKRPGGSVDDVVYGARRRHS